MAAWSRKTLKFCYNFLRFFLKTSPYGTVFKILFQTFSSRHWSMWLCSNFVKCGRRKIGEIERYLVAKKQNLGCLSNCRYSADRHRNPPASAPTMYSECPSFHPFYFWRSYSRTRESNIRPKPSFEPNNKTENCLLLCRVGHYGSPLN